MFDKLTEEQNAKYTEILTYFRSKDANATDEEIQIGIVVAGIEAMYPLMRLAKSHPKILNKIKAMGRKLGQ
jgi:hypothetical protein